MEQTVEQAVLQPQKENEQKKTFGKRVEHFFERNFALLLAPIIVLIFYLIGLNNQGVYPFGDKYTAASYDLSAQICPFIEHLFDVFDGKSTLTYSHAIVGGADVTGTFLYFFISPFSFLFLIFGDGMVAHASSIVMACKLATIAFVGTWFAKKVFSNIPDYVCIGVGVLYTYCGYMFVSNTYINWMDFLIYGPFCVAAFKHMVKTGKFLPFSILIACCIYTCFSIGCFALLTVYPALVCYAIFCVEKDKRNKFISTMSLSFVVAFLISLPILVPAFGAFTNSARGGSLFENFWKGALLDGNQVPVGVKENAGTVSGFTGFFQKSLYAKWTYIFSDAVFVILTLVWFIRKGLKDSMAKFMLAAGVLTLLPLIVDESMLLLNMGSYMSYALRFGFLNALYFLGGACLALDGLCYQWNKAYDGTPLFDDTPLWTRSFAKEQAKAKGDYRKFYTVMISVIIVGILGIAATIFTFWYGDNKNYVNFFESFGDSDTIKSVKGFAASFAHSLGGLEVVIVVFVVIGIVMLVGGALVSWKKISVGVLSVIMLVVVGSQVSFYNTSLIQGNSSTQHVKYGNYQTLSATLNEMNGDEYFRLKDYGTMKSDGRDTEFTSSIPFTGNSNSFSVFSSVIDADNFAAFQLFGYNGNQKNNFKSVHSSNKSNRGDEFGDSFLGYKYFIVHKNQKSTVEKLSYMEKVMVVNESGEKVHLSDGNYYIYENKIVFPLGYALPKGNLTLPYDLWANDKSHRKWNQQYLYRFLRGKDMKTVQAELGLEESEYITPATATELSEHLWKRAADVDVSAGKIVAKINAKQGECLFLNFVASKGYTVTVNGKKAELIENDLNFLSVALEEGDNEVVFTYSSPYVKHFAVGIGGAVLSLLLVALVLKKTKLLDTLSPVIAWTGIVLAAGVFIFFMLYPTGAFVAKLMGLLKLKLL